MTRVMDRSKRGSDADDVGGVEARGSGEGMCLRRSMYDQHARRAALDSSLDDDQHELLTSVRIIVHNRTRLSTLKMNSSSRSSSSRLARAHERAGRGRAGRASKRGHRGHIVRSLMGWPRGAESNNFRNCLTDLCHVISRGENQQPCVEKKFEHETLRTWYTLFVFSARCLLNESRLGFFSYSIFRQRL